MKTLARGTVITGVLVFALLVAIGRFPIAGDGKPTGRTHKVPEDIKRGTVRLTVNWDAEAIIQSATFHAGPHEETYGHDRMSASTGSLSRDYPYVGGAFYAVTANQTDHDAGFTECVITVAGVVVDQERLENGAGTVYCFAK